MVRYMAGEGQAGRQAGSVGNAMHAFSPLVASLCVGTPLPSARLLQAPGPSPHKPALAGPDLTSHAHAATSQAADNLLCRHPDGRICGGQADQQDHEEEHLGVGGGTTGVGDGGCAAGLLSVDCRREACRACGPAASVWPQAWAGTMAGGLGVRGSVPSQGTHQAEGTVGHYRVHCYGCKHRRDRQQYHDDHHAAAALAGAPAYGGEGGRGYGGW